MTKEDKELLLKDLCARLPYKVVVQYKGHNCHYFNNNKRLTGADLDCNMEYYKPYLRSMDSMTEEEKKEYEKVCELDTEILANHPMNGDPFPALYNSQDWLNAHHFDYRGLIPKGLALEAPEDMYKM